MRNSQTISPAAALAVQESQCHQIPHPSPAASLHPAECQHLHKQLKIKRRNWQPLLSHLGRRDEVFLCNSS